MTKQVTPEIDDQPSRRISEVLDGVRVVMRTTETDDGLEARPLTIASTPRRRARRATRAPESPAGSGPASCPRPMRPDPYDDARPTSRPGSAMAADGDSAADRRRRAQRSVDPDLPTEALRGPHHRHAPGVLLAISAGGIAGTLARYGVGRALAVGPGAFPWATFTVNVSGSLALGMLLTLTLARWPADRYVRPFAAIGFIGAYTTFSTFVVDADVLAKEGHVVTAAVYVVVSLVGGLAAVGTGVLLTRSLLERGST